MLRKTIAGRQIAMGISNIKSTYDDLNTIIEITTDPKFSNIIPEIVNGLTKLMGAGTAIGKVFLEIHKPAFEALDLAIAAAEKNWPMKSACIGMQQLMVKMEHGKKAAADVLGEPARSLTIADFLKLGRDSSQKIKRHLAQIDKLIDANFQVCLARQGFDAMIKHSDSRGKRENSFDVAFWGAIKNHHRLNLAKFKLSYSNSVTRLVNHRNGWAKWFGVTLHQRPRKTLLL